MDRTGPENDAFPTGITVKTESRTLYITWESGDPSDIPWTTLRLNCPCAQCQGEDRSHSPDHDRIVNTPSETELSDVVLMGHYALQPTWASGHATGIYTWKLLQGLAKPGEDEGQPAR